MFPEGVGQALEPPGENLAHHGVVVNADDILYLEAAVVGSPGLAVLEDDHAADGVRALYIGYVVALDAVGRFGEAERFLEVVHSLAVVGGFVNPADGELFEALGGVLRYHLDQLSLLAALGDVKLDRSPPLGSQPRLDGVHVVGQALEQDTARDVGVGGVELL